MSSYIQFTPLSGVWSEGPLAYQLSVDQAHVLLDCGWSATFDAALLEPVIKVAKQMDCILLSHADIDHLGGLVFVYTRLQLRCPIYATLPVCQMGRLCMLDVVRSLCLGQDFDLFTADDVHRVFDTVHSLKYMEVVALSGNCQGITITPCAAGHTVGGTVWRIKKDTDDVVYAVNYNHRKDRHLNGTMLESLVRPSLLITDAYNATQVQSLRKLRDAELFGRVCLGFTCGVYRDQLVESILSTLRSDGNALLPIDSSTRVLEIAFVLDQLWSHHQLSYPLILLTTQARRTIEYAKSMLEWMGDGVSKQFATTRESPFEFRHVKVCQALRDLDRFQSPKVILASLDSLESGFARDLFFASCAYPQNMVLFTSRGQPGTLKSLLVDAAIHKKRVGEIEVTVKRRVPLAGPELEEFLRMKREQEEQARMDEAIQERKKRILEGLDEENEADEDDVDQQMLFIGDRYDHFTLGTKSSELTFFANESRTVMFPCAEYRMKLDEYGEVIDPQKYRALSAEATLSQVPEMVPSEEAMAEDEDADDQVEESVPTKAVTHAARLPVQCALKYIDLEGLSDGKAIKTILQHISPRKIIVVRGDRFNTNHLLQFCRESGTLFAEVYAPQIEESVNVSSATNIYQVRLTDALISSLTFRKQQDHDVVFVRGRILFQSHGGEGETEPQRFKDDIPVLDVPNPETRWRSHRSIFVGEGRLTELKRQLQLEGIPADFDRGHLIIGEEREFRVQKNADGNLILEGPCSRTYYRIRRFLYNMHSIL